MGIYKNCHDMLKDLRLGLNEYSTGLWQGTSTSGKFNNDWLVEQLNAAQRQIYNRLLRLIPERFMTSASVAVTSSVITLPNDFGRLYLLTDSNKRKIHRTTPSILPQEGSTGSERMYYISSENTLTLNKSGVTDTYTLWYYTKPIDLTQGQATADNTLATSAKALADYYNGATIESITGGWAGTVADYTAARVVTVTGQTLTNAHYYGTVSQLPEMFRDLIAPLAVIIAKSIHPRSQEKPTAIEIASWNTRWDDARFAYMGHDDISIEEIFTDYNTPSGVGGVTIPGLGYLV